MLEHHAHLFTADLLKGGAFKLLNVDAVDQYFTVGDVVQFVDRTNRRRLTRTGQAHDYEGLASIDRERNVGHTNNVIGGGLHLVLVETLLRESEGSTSWLWSEDLEHAV